MVTIAATSPFTVRWSSAQTNPTASCYCALDSITVGTHEANPTMDQCTDCKVLPAKVLLISPQCRKKGRICPTPFSRVLL